MRWQDSRRSSNVEDYRGSRFGGAGLKLGIGGTLIALVAGYFLGIDPERDPRSDRIAALRGPAPQAQRARRRMSRASSSPPCSAKPKTPGAPSSRPNGATYSRRSSCCSPDQVRSGCGVGQLRGRARSTARRDQQGVHRPRLLQRAEDALRRRPAISRRRTCSRTRWATTCRRCSAPKRKCAPRSSGASEAGAQSATGEDGAAGGLLRRRVGAQRGRDPAHSRAGRRGGGAGGRFSRRRRHHPEAHAGHVVPDSFTHGIAEQRMTWFKRGLDTGQVQACDTFTRAERVALS